MVYEDLSAAHGRVYGRVAEDKPVPPHHQKRGPEREPSVCPLPLSGETDAPERLAGEVVDLQGCPAPYLAGPLARPGRQELEGPVDKARLSSSRLYIWLELRRYDEVPPLEVEVAYAAQINSGPLPGRYGIPGPEEALYAPCLDPLSARIAYKLIALSDAARGDRSGHHSAKALYRKRAVYREPEKAVFLYAA